MQAQEQTFLIKDISEVQTIAAKSKTPRFQATKRGRLGETETFQIVVGTNLWSLFRQKQGLDILGKRRV
jgi:hypothetical protein